MNKKLTHTNTNKYYHSNAQIHTMLILFVGFFIHIICYLFAFVFQRFIFFTLHFVVLYCAALRLCSLHTDTALLDGWFSFSILSFMFAHVDCCAKVIKHDFDLVTLDEDRVLLFTRSFTIQKQFGLWIVCVWLLHFFIHWLCIPNRNEGQKLTTLFYLNSFSFYYHTQIIN